MTSIPDSSVALPTHWDDKFLPKHYRLSADGLAIHYERECHPLSLLLVILSIVSWGICICGNRVGCRREKRAHGAFYLESLVCAIVLSLRVVLIVLRVYQGG